MSCEEKAVSSLDESRSRSRMWSEAKPSRETFGSRSSPPLKKFGQVWEHRSRCAFVIIKGTEPFF